MPNSKYRVDTIVPKWLKITTSLGIHDSVNYYNTLHNYWTHFFMSHIVSIEWKLKVSPKYSVSCSSVYGS